MKKILFVIPTIVLFAACSSSPDLDNYPELPDAQPILLKSGFENKINQDNTFAFDLFKTTSLSKTDPNIFISPLSVSMALSMTLNGANGETREEMEYALRIAGYSSEEINDYWKSLSEALTSVDPSSQLSIANSIWYRLGFFVENSFIQTNRNYYNAEVRETDFSNPASKDQINQWCANKTNNKIPEIIENISDDMVMYLINAVYFKGIWKYRFLKENTQSDYFHTDNNQKKEVQMMVQENNFPYYSDENMAYMEMPYGNNAFSMIVMLPHEGKTIKDAISLLNNDSWNNALSGMYPAKVNVHFPKFKSECEYNLHQGILQQMGMKLAFQSGGIADFRGINKSRDLYISEVKHKTFIEVNEEGTEAAAVTSVGISYTSVQPTPQPIHFIVNKPFLFAIKEKSTGIILFIGKIGDIKS